MATLEFKPPQSVEPEPELDLLMPKSQDDSLWESLVHNFKDTFFPEKIATARSDLEAGTRKRYLGLLRLQKEQRYALDDCPHRHRVADPDRYLLFWQGSGPAEAERNGHAGCAL